MALILLSSVMAMMRLPPCRKPKSMVSYFGPEIRKRNKPRSLTWILRKIVCRLLLTCMIRLQRNKKDEDFIPVNCLNTYIAEVAAACPAQDRSIFSTFETSFADQSN